MTDETTEPQEQPEEAEPSGDTKPMSGRPGHEGHSIKKELREGAAKVAGYAVEIGSILGGQGGDIVQAEKAVAEDDTEEFLDRIDGNG